MLVVVEKREHGKTKEDGGLKAAQGKKKPKVLLESKWEVERREKKYSNRDTPGSSTDVKGNQEQKKKERKEDLDPFAQCTMVSYEDYVQDCQDRGIIPKPFP